MTSSRLGEPLMSMRQNPSRLHHPRQVRAILNLSTAARDRCDAAERVQSIPMALGWHCLLPQWCGIVSVAESVKTAHYTTDSPLF